MTLRWGDTDPAVFRGEEHGVGVFEEDEAEDTLPTELCFGEPYGLAFGVVEDEATLLLLLLLGLALLPDDIILAREPFVGDDDDDEGGFDNDLLGGTFLGLCCVEDLWALLLGGISLGSLEDFWGR